VIKPQSIHRRNSPAAVRLKRCDSEHQAIATSGQERVRRLEGTRLTSLAVTLTKPTYISGRCSDDFAGRLIGGSDHQLKT